MVQDNPKQEELHEMIKFIAQNKQIYIYMGDIILAKNISKYLYYVCLSNENVSKRAPKK